MKKQVNLVRPALSDTFNKAENFELVKRQPLIVFNRCSNCNSTNTYYRVKGKNCLCRKCGNVFKVVVKPNRKKVS
jgi:ribosomal protein L37AE/L43A